MDGPGPRVEDGGPLLTVGGLLPTWMATFGAALGATLATATAAAASATIVVAPELPTSSLMRAWNSRGRRCGGGVRLGG